MENVAIILQANHGKGTAVTAKVRPWKLKIYLADSGGFGIKVRERTLQHFPELGILSILQLLSDAFAA
jgi:hypothetical protein